MKDAEGTRISWGTHMIVGLGPSSANSHGGGVETAGYVRSISTISPGSLSSAYRAMRSLEGADAAPAVAMPVPMVPMAADEAAVVRSAQGIPGAFAAYGEVIDDA